MRVGLFELHNPERTGEFRRALSTAFDLTTAYGLATATFVSSFDVSGKETAPYGVHLSDDGIKLFVIGPDSDSVHRYDL